MTDRMISVPAALLRRASMAAYEAGWTNTCRDLDALLEQPTPTEDA